MVEKISDKLIELNIVQAEDRELYEFGIRGIFSLSLNICLMLCIGGVMGMIWQAAIFSIVYGTVRIYAGGYHAPTLLRCFVYSAGMLAGALLLIGQVAINGYLLIGLTWISATIIYMLSPSEHVNKPLVDEERKAYKKKVGKLELFYSIVSLALFFTGLTEILKCIAIANMCLLGMVLINTISKKTKAK